MVSAKDFFCPMHKLLSNRGEKRAKEAISRFFFFNLLKICIIFSYDREVSDQENDHSQLLNVWLQWKQQQILMINWTAKVKQQV